jgi:hypothetical protein
MTLCFDDRQLLAHLEVLLASRTCPVAQQNEFSQVATLSGGGKKQDETGTHTHIWQVHIQDPVCLGGDAPLLRRLEL